MSSQIQRMVVLGAEVGSNNTAELSAIAHALRWVVLEKGIEAAIVRSDSTYAEYSLGDLGGKGKSRISKESEFSMEEVSGLIILSGEHVPAHTGHRWNERADHLAFRAMKGESPLPLQFWKPGRGSLLLL